MNVNWGDNDWNITAFLICADFDITVLFTHAVSVIALSMEYESFNIL